MVMFACHEWVPCSKHLDGFLIIKCLRSNNPGSKSTLPQNVDVAFPPDCSSANQQGNSVHLTEFVGCHRTGKNREQALRMCVDKRSLFKWAKNVIVDFTGRNVRHVPQNQVIGSWIPCLKPVDFLGRPKASFPYLDFN